MCGIVGYIGDQNATPIILNGLKRLEYRGYDSAGLAVLQDGHIEVRRDAGKLNKLISMVEMQPIQGTMGIGHTRWATHGEPNARNAHPHLGSTKEVVVVHNGIVENFLELREDLSAEGVTFNSDTDTEVIVHLIERFMSGGDLLRMLPARHCASSRGRMAWWCSPPANPIKLSPLASGMPGASSLGLGMEKCSSRRMFPLFWITPAK